MNTNETLKQTVLNLSPDELLEFSNWFEEFMADQWDKQIEADILKGQLDKIANAVDDDFISGRVTPL